MLQISIAINEINIHIYIHTQSKARRGEEIFHPYLILQFNLKEGKTILKKNANLLSVGLSCTVISSYALMPISLEF